MSIMRSFEFRNKICDSSYIYVYVYIYVYILYIYFCYGTFYLFYIVRVTTRRFASSDRRLACEERWHEAMQTFFSFYPSLTVGRRAMIHDFYPRFIHTIVTFIIHIYKSVLVLFSLSAKVSARVK